jgi:hypothetical protein
MATAETAAAPTRELTAWYGSAFGVLVRAAEEIETLTACPTAAGGEATIWTRVSERDGLAREWSAVEVGRLVDFRFRDGRPMMSIDVDRDGAYLVEAPGYGAHVVSHDGMRITSVLAPDASWNWQRLFVAQALPLAASMRGLELLHASAVNLDGRVLALTASSGAGKTSIAMHLVADGGTLVTDDVLAVGSTPTGVVGYPGARLMNADRDELATIATGRDRLGVKLGDDEKVHLRPALESAPLPLAALYRLVSRPGGSTPRIVEEAPPDPSALLGTTFLPYVQTPARLTRNLELASRLARSVRVFVLEIPHDLSAAQTASLLERHVVGCDS